MKRMRYYKVWMVTGLLAVALPSALPISAQRMDEGVAHSKYIQAVDEYRPAPGQYVKRKPRIPECGIPNRQKNLRLQKRYTQNQ